MLLDQLTSLADGPDRSPSGSGLSSQIVFTSWCRRRRRSAAERGLPYANGDADAADTDGFAPNAFIRIERGQVTLIIPYVEMGQGTYTSIPMLIAEELEVELKQVQLEHAPPNEKLYGNPLLGGVQATGGSTAMRAAWEPMRRAGATASTMLVSAAAKRWNVDLASCRAHGGEVLHPPTGRRLKYRELAAAAARMPVPAKRRAQADRRISSSSARRPSVWTRRRRSTERLSMASTFGRRA